MQLSTFWEILDRFSEHFSSFKISGYELKEINNAKIVNLITEEADPERIYIWGNLSYNMESMEDWDLQEENAKLELNVQCLYWRKGVRK